MADLVNTDFKRASDGKNLLGAMYIGRRPIFDYDGRLLDKKPVPQVIVGYHLDDNGALKALDTFKTSAKENDIIRAVHYLDQVSLPISAWQHQTTQTRANVIDTRSLMTLTVKNFDRKKGAINKLQPRYLPDVIAARASAIHNSKCKPYHSDIETGRYTRYGIGFHASLLGDPDPNNKQADIDATMNTVPHPSVDKIISQDDIDAITRWSVKFSAIVAKSPFVIRHRPALGTWPLWNDIPIPGENSVIMPCSAKTAMTRHDAHKRLMHLT